MRNNSPKDIVRKFTALMVLLVCALSAQMGRAQVSILSTGTPYPELFDGMGSAATATLPTGFKIGTDWAVGLTATTLAYGTTGVGAVTGSSSGGTINWANGVTASATDRSLGFLNTGSFSSPRSITYAFTNNTGATVTSLNISFDYEKSRSGTRQYDWTFFHGSTSTPTTAATAGDQSYPSDANNTTISNPPTTTSKSFALSSLSIPNGSTYYLKWTFTGLAGSTNGQGIGLDNFSITAGGAPPVLVPSTIAFGAATPGSVVVNMNGGNGTGRILVVRQGSAVGFVPTNGNSPGVANSDITLGAVLGGGDVLVYNASGTSVTVTGLSPTTTYHFATWDYDGTVTYSASSSIANMTTPGPIPYSTGTYTQDFNGLPSSGGFTPGAIGPFYAGAAPVNATGMQGWQYTNTNGSNVTFAVNDGSSNTGSVYSYGTGAAADRAFGSLAGTVVARLGAVIRNTSASPFTSFTISFTGEQWRDGQSNTPNALAFSYSLNGTDISTGTYTAVSSLDFISPISSSGAGLALDGNQPANQTAVSFTVNMPGNWMPGTELVVRWSDNNDSGADDGLAIDGFSFSASGPVAPVVQDHDISFANVTTVGADVNWINGDGTKRMVVLNTANSFTNPSNGSETTGNSVYGGGEQVVYVGTGSTVSVSNLAPSTPYFARVFAYNGVTASAVYNTSTAVDNPNTFTTATPIPPTQLVITSINGGVDPIQYSPPFFPNTFSVTVQSQDGSNSPQDVSANTNVLLSLNFGNGLLAGTLTGTILAGTHEVTITGVNYDTAEGGVIIDAARTSGDVLTTGTSAAFTVLGVPTDLVFTNVPFTGLVGVPVPTFQVEARRADSSVDGNYGGMISLSVLSGPGTIGGTTAVNAINGIASFSNVTFSAAGQYQLEANATGIFAGQSSLINITLTPTMTELVVPRYMGSKSGASANTNRTPFAVCLQFDNLVPNTLYDVRAGVALASDAGTTYGAGNIWNGITYGTTNLTGTFTSDGTGSSGPYWLFIQPTGNGTRFGGGQVHNLRISTMINGNASPSSPQFVGAKTITSLDIATTALTPATTDDGAYLRGVAGACVSGKFILAYDNVAGTGDPLTSFQAITTTPSDVTVGNYSGHPVSISDLYKQNGTAAIGDYPGVVPIGANNGFGVQRIEARNVDNTLFSSITDADGVWPGGANFTTIARRAVGTVGATDPQLAPDGDNDGTADCLDGCPIDPNKIAPGACGCGVADVPATYYADSDNDGLGDPASPVPGFTCTVPPGAVANNTDPCPSIQNGNPGDACDDGNNFTFDDQLGASPNCGCAGTACTQSVVIVISTDGGGLRWTLRNSLNNAIIQKSTGYPAYDSPPASPNYTVTTCLPNGSFYFTLEDQNCDGIVNGGYSVTVGGKRVIDNSNNMNLGCPSAIAGNTGVNVPVGNDRLISASCDRLDLRRGVSGACSDKLTADNTPNGITPANTAVYQFWIFDPNGGTSIFYPSATGVTTNQVSMFSLPSLLDNKLYNVRVRTRISPGVFRPWGSACRFMINNTLGQCPVSKLQDEVDNAHLSCGKIMTLGSGAQNLVYAKPATRFTPSCATQAANKYQFRFRLPNEGKVIVKYGVGSSPWTYLNNANMVAGGFGHVLELCKDYQVEVRASFDVGGTWCAGGANPYTDLTPWGDACMLYTTLTGCLNGGGQHMALESDVIATSLKLYPNPNNGQQLYLSLDRIEEGVSTVSMDIYDTFGKRVSARTIAVADGFINTVLELNGELAAGMYLVNITAGDATHTQRLVVQP